jgi:L-fuculose-phosphate aldolase
MSYEKEKEEIIFWGRQLYQSGLNSGSSGNISKRIGENLLITAHGSYLGFLNREDIILMDKRGEVLDGDKESSSEKPLHLAVYNDFPENSVVIHVHSPYTTYYFHYFDTLNFISFEEKFNLGNIIAIPQATPTVTDISPVINALEKNDIVVLKNHGVVAIGKNFVSTFSLIELLEINVRLNLMSPGPANQKK